MKPKYFIIINRTLAPEIPQTIWPTVKQRLNHNQIRYSVANCTYKQRTNLVTREFIKEARSGDILMIIGNDKMLNQVLNSAKTITNQHPQFPVLPIAYLPTSSRSDFAYRHHFPANYKQILNQILFKSSVRRIPIGTFYEKFKKERQFFVSNVEISSANSPFKIINDFRNHWYSPKRWWETAQLLYNLQTFPLSLYQRGKTQILKNIVLVNVQIKRSTSTVLNATIIEKHGFLDTLTILFKWLLHKKSRRRFVHHLTGTNFHFGIPTLEYGQADGNGLGSRYYNINYCLTEYPFII